MSRERTDPSGTLTPKQAMFCIQYVKCNGNGYQAAVAAGYSERTARGTASALLTKPNIRAEIDRRTANVLDRAEVSAEWTLREILRLASVDVSQAFDEDGELLPINKIPADIRKMISGVDVQVDGRDGSRVKKIRFWSKEKGLEMLAKHLKLLTEKHEHSLTDELAEKLERARARAQT